MGHVKRQLVVTVSIRLLAPGANRQSFILNPNFRERNGLTVGSRSAWGFSRLASPSN